MRILTMRRDTGFSLVELLTVIGVIAILAAIIFPMANGARRQVAQTNCAQNMHTIIQGLKMYKLDERRFPVTLFPYDPEAEPTTDKPYLRGMKDAHGPLFPEYVKAVSIFHCPADVSRKDDTLSYFTRDLSMDPADPQKKTTLYFYYYDSYDGQFSMPVTPGANGGPVVDRGQNTEGTPPLDQTGYYELHYIRDWGATGLALEDPNQLIRQLKWRNPPEDTVVTWCTYHASPRNPHSSVTLKTNLNNKEKQLNAGSIYLVAFLDGSVRKTPCSEVINSLGCGGFAEPGP